MTNPMILFTSVKAVGHKHVAPATEYMCVLFKAIAGGMSGTSHRPDISFSAISHELHSLILQTASLCTISQQLNNRFGGSTKDKFLRWKCLSEYVVSSTLLPKKAHKVVPHRIYKETLHSRLYRRSQFYLNTSASS